MAGDHTADVVVLLSVLSGLLPTLAQAEPVAPPPEVDFTVGSVLGALALACVFAMPLGISLWALLDAAKRPGWAWAFAGRRQAVWMAGIMFLTLSVIGGLLISGWYLLKVRPIIAAVEDGDISPG